MTALRASLVNAVTLSRIASGLDMDSYMLLSKGEAKAWAKRGNIFSPTLLRRLSEPFILMVAMIKFLVS